MPESPRAGKLAQWALLAGAVAFAAWIYAWKPASFPRAVFSERPVSFYHELTEAFLAGQMHLQRVPDPRLVALPDPYDPVANSPYRVNDLSYFNGRYYLYLGVAPALLLFLPLKLATGLYLTEEWAIIVFGAVGFAAGLALVMRLRRQIGASGFVLAAAAGALALGQGYYVVLGGAIAQQVAVACAYASVMTGLWALARAVEAGEHAGIWFSLASLAFGTAVASRPNYVFACAALLPPWLVWWRARGSGWSPSVMRCGLALILPVSLCVTAILAANLVRFGHVFEFGQRYQLGDWDQRHLAYSGLGHGWENLWYYLVSPGHYSRYFPWITAPTWTATGVLRHVPWLWLFPLAGWALCRREVPAAWRALGISALWLGASNLVTLVFLPSGNPAAILTSANARYVLDFLPGLVLFVGIGLLTIPRIGGHHRRPAMLLSLASGATAFASALIGFGLQLSYFPAENYRSTAEILNRPVAWLEALRSQNSGPMALNVRFPAQPGTTQPLVSTGTLDQADLVYVRLLDGNRAQFGLVGSGLEGPLGNPVALAPDKVHRVEIHMGSLYPPIGHPALAGLGIEAIAPLKRRVKVMLDGQEVLNDVARFHPAEPDEVYLGKNPFLVDQASAEFSGRIDAVQRLGIIPPEKDAITSPVFGAVQLTLRFPQARNGEREPLVVAGVPQAGDFVYVHYLADGRLQLGFDHWGRGGLITEPLAVDRGQTHLVETSFGGLYPPRGGPVPPPEFAEDKVAVVRGQVRILLDGVPVLAKSYDSYESSPYDVVIGRNVIGGSTCVYRFSGEIIAVRRLPLP